MSKNQVDKTAKDEDQRLYRDYFNITDMYLIQYSYDPDKKGDDKNGGEKTCDHERGVRHVVPELPGSVFGDGSPGRETTVSPGAGKSYRGRTGFSSRVSICRENTKGETGFLVDEVGRHYAAGIRERKKR